MAVIHLMHCRLMRHAAAELYRFRSAQFGSNLQYFRVVIVNVWQMNHEEGQHEGFVSMHDTQTKRETQLNESFFIVSTKKKKAFWESC